MLWTTAGAQTDENMFGDGGSEEPTTETLAKAVSIFSTTAAEPGKTPLRRQSDIAEHGAQSDRECPDHRA